MLTFEEGSIERTAGRRYAAGQIDIRTVSQTDRQMDIGVYEGTFRNKNEMEYVPVDGYLLGLLEQPYNKFNVNRKGGTSPMFTPWSIRTQKNPNSAVTLLGCARPAL